MMTLTLGSFVAVSVYLGYRWMRRNSVSTGWLREQDRYSWTRGEDGVCWRWPVEK